jgi:hypothetical protein
MRAISILRAMFHPASVVRPVYASSFARAFLGWSACAALSATLLACGTSSSNSGSGGEGQGGTKATAGETSTGAKSGSGTGGDKTDGGKGMTDGGSKTGDGGAPSEGGTGGTMPMGNGGMVDFGDYPLVDLPEVGSAGVDYLSDLPWKKAVVFPDFGAPGSEGPIGKDRSVDLKSPLVINGKAYKKGLGVQTYSQITYALDGKYKKFVSDTGLDFTQNSASMIFEVLVDDKLVYDGGESTKTKDQMVPVEVDVTGAKEIQLYVRDGFDDKSDDFGVWGGARLLK